MSFTSSLEFKVGCSKLEVKTLHGLRMHGTTLHGKREDFKMGSRIRE
jgi:hypothetical protein